MTVNAFILIIVAQQTLITTGRVWQLEGNGRKAHLINPITGSGLRTKSNKNREQSRTPFRGLLIDRCKINQKGRGEGRRTARFCSETMRLAAGVWSMGGGAGVMGASGFWLVFGVLGPLRIAQAPLPPPSPPTLIPSLSSSFPPPLHLLFRLSKMLFLLPWPWPLPNCPPFSKIALWLFLWPLALGSQQIPPTQSVSYFPEPPLSTPESYQLSVLGADQFPRSDGYSMSFAELIKQKQSGNKLDQCPCVVLPGSNKCVVYDARYQAALPEEAMITFVDSSMDPRIFDQRLGGQQISASTLECKTEECRQCVGMMALRLRQVGFLKNPPLYSFSVPGANQLRPGGCPRLRMSRAIPRYNPPAPPSQFTRTSLVHRAFLDLISAGAPLRQSMERQAKSAFELKAEEAVQLGRQAASNQALISLLIRAERSPKSPATGPYSPAAAAPADTRRRHLREGHAGERPSRKEKRQVPSNRRGAEPIIGKRFVINCVERGEPENENTDFLNLCTTCWTWRQLPEDYFPRLLNELVCKEHDYCLSGWGVCNQRYRNLDVLQRVRVGGQEEWRPTTISAASCCDCKVKAGSQAHSLVVGGKS